MAEGLWSTAVAALRDRPLELAGFLVATACVAALESVGAVICSANDFARTGTWLVAIVAAQGCVATFLVSRVARQSLNEARRLAALRDVAPTAPELVATAGCSGVSLTLAAAIVRAAVVTITWGASSGWWLDKGPAALLAPCVGTLLAAFAGWVAPSKPLSAWLRERGGEALGRERRMMSELTAIGAEAAAHRRFWRRTGELAASLDLRWAAGFVIPRLTALAVVGAAVVIFGPFLLSGSDWRGSAVSSIGIVAFRIIAEAFCVAVALRNLRLHTHVRAAPAHVAWPSEAGPEGSGLWVEGLRLAEPMGDGDRLDASFHTRPDDILLIRVRSRTEQLGLMEGLLGVRPLSARVASLNGQASPNARHWRSRCAFIPARTELAQRSLRENLSMTAPEASEPLLRAALNACAPSGGAHQLLASFKGRTALGPTRLEAAEQRSVVFARAIVRRPELLVVEAPWPNVAGFDDGRTAALLRALARRCTVVIVSLDAHPCDVADEVISLDFGAPAANA